MRLRRTPGRLALTIATFTSALTLVVWNGVAAADPAFTSAHPVTGLAALNVDGTANIDDVSCSSNGNCGAVGTYIDGSAHVQGFVANETGGVWGAATPIPGLADLNAGGAVRDNVVISCTAAGECEAGGRYTDANQVKQAFIAQERAGVWGSAFEVPRDSSIPPSDGMRLVSIVCTSPGQCVAGGLYFVESGTNQEPWVAVETNGTWAGAMEVPGMAVLDPGQLGTVASMACPAPGSCVLTGYYADAAMNDQVFVDSQVAGVWGTAQPLPGLIALNAGGVATSSQIACSSVGNCAVGGLYSPSAGVFDAFVADEVSGVWGNAQELPGSGALNSAGLAAITSVACPGDGKCEAVGEYALDARTVQAMVASETNGTWGDAIVMPGMFNLNLLGNSGAASVSCVSVGDCRAVGLYQDLSGNIQGFISSETGGTWTDTEVALGSQDLNVKGNGALETVSCTSDGACAAGGQYEDASGFQQAMIIDASTSLARAPGAPSAHAVSRSKGKVSVTVHAGSSGGNPITEYEYSVNGGAWHLGSRGATTFVVSHLKSKSKIHLRVRAVNGVGAGRASPPVSVTVR